MWNLSVIVNKAVSRAASSIRDLRLPTCDFENQQWEISFYSKIGGLYALRSIDSPADMSDSVLELLFLAPRRSGADEEEAAKMEIATDMHHAQLNDSQGNAVPGTPPRAPGADLFQIRLSKPAPTRGRFPLLERITFRRLTMSEQVFGKLCRANPHLTEVDFIHCRGKKVTEQHLQRIHQHQPFLWTFSLLACSLTRFTYRSDLLDAPKLSKNVAFFWAVGFNHSAYCMQLLERYPREIDVNLHHRSGQTPLTRACKKRYWTTVLDLIRSGRGVDVNVKARDGIAALHYAARDDNVDVLRELIRAGARVDEPKSDGCRSLHIAATYGWVNVVKALLEANADVNAASKAGSTALHYASLYGQPEALKVLLAAKPAVDALYTGGWTALHLAVRRNYLDMARALLDASANPDVSETHGWTPLHSAVYKGYSTMVALLLKYSPSLEAVDKKHGRTPLHFAAMTNVGPVPPAPVSATDAGTILRLLIDANANINAAQSKARTPLHLAAGNGFEKGVDMLLVRGANMWLKDRWHSTALHYAVDSGSESTVARLLMHERESPPPKLVEDEVERRVPHGCDQRTPLFTAAQKGLRDIVQLLLLHPNHRNEVSTLCYGLTPLEAALLTNNSEVAKVVCQAMGSTGPDIDAEAFSLTLTQRNDLIHRVLDRERYMPLDQQFVCDGRKRAQNFWRCLTCFSDIEALCSTCAVKCHPGHQLDWRGVGISFCSCPCAVDADVKARKESKTKNKAGDVPFGPHMPQYRSVQQNPHDALAASIPRHKLPQ